MKPPQRPSRPWVRLAAVLLLIGGSVASWVWAPARVAPPPDLGPSLLDLARQDMVSLRNGIQLFRLRERRLPSVLADLYGPDGVMDGDAPWADPWGNAYRYEPTGERTFTLRCSGPDGIEGSADDLGLGDPKR